MIHIFLIRIVSFHLNFVTDTEFRMYQMKISLPSGMSEVACTFAYFIPFEMAKFKECTVCEDLKAIFTCSSPAILDTLTMQPVKNRNKVYKRTKWKFTWNNSRASCTKYRTSLVSDYKFILQELRPRFARPKHVAGSLRWA